jgi:hypothetical protein
MCYQSLVFFLLLIGKGNFCILRGRKVKETRLILNSSYDNDKLDQQKRYRQQNSIQLESLKDDI